MKFNRNWPHRRIEIGRLRTQFQCFWANSADRWPRRTGARLIKVQLHSKSFGGALNWPLTGGSRLIEVAATAGLTVCLLHARQGHFSPKNLTLHFAMIQDKNHKPMAKNNLSYYHCLYSVELFFYKKYILGKKAGK